MIPVPESFLARALRHLAWRCDAITMRRYRARHRANASDAVCDWDWAATPFNRIALVNHLLRRIPDAAYLEIGCDREALFRSVPVADKTGVDPVRGGTVRSTSDAFFATNDRRFDLCFIDGLHSYEQTRRDVVAALAAMKPGGWILIHDLLPRSWEEEHVPRFREEWTGDVWKVAVDLAASPDVDFAIAAIDHGVGIVRPHVPQARLAESAPGLSEARFAAFCEIVPSLPVLGWDETLDWIARLDPR